MKYNLQLLCLLFLFVCTNSQPLQAQTPYRGANVTKEWEEVRYGTQTRALRDILKTKANVVRLPWIKDKFGTVAETILRVQKMVNTARNSGRLVILDNHEYTGWGYSATHDATAKKTNMQRIVDDWVLWKTFLAGKNNIVVNIANEWGGTSGTAMSDETWRDQYIFGVQELRRQGITNTLMIDANEWGQGANSILKYGKAIMAADPLNKVVFSVHIYGAWRDTNPTASGGYHIDTTMKRLKDNGTPAFVGEFGNSYGERNDSSTHNNSSVIRAAEAHGLGWTAWSWTRAPNLNDTNLAFRTDSYTSNGGDPTKLSIFGKIMVDGFDDGQMNSIALGY